MRILVVDDLDTNREILETYLEDIGYQVDTVGSGSEAIQALGSERYDLVLMDIQMPIMDGVTATKCIRALPDPIKDIPIIAMTGHVLPQQVRSLLEAGMSVTLGRTSLPAMDSMTCPAVAVEIAPELGPDKKVIAELDDPDYQARVATALAAALVQWRAEAHP